MTPVTAAIDFSAGTQAGGREPAPGELGLVQAFVNSHYDLERDEGGELFHSPSALTRWLRSRGLLEASRSLTRTELRRALDAREGLRAMLAANNGVDWDADAVDRLNHAASRPGAVIQFSPDGPSFDSYERDFDGALGVTRDQLHALALRVVDQGAREGEQVLVTRRHLVEVAVAAHEWQEVVEIGRPHAGDGWPSHRRDALRRLRARYARAFEREPQTAIEHQALAWLRE